MAYPEEQTDPLQQILSQINPQSQGDSGVLGMLTQLLSPASAEAAQRSVDPWQRQYQELQLRSREQAQRNQEALRQQQMQQQQQQFEARQAQQKATATAKSQPPDISAVLKALQPQQQGSQVPELDIRSVSPTTGTPYFSNYKAADYASPEEKQRVAQLYAERQAKVAEQAQPRAGGGAELRAQVAASLKGKLPDAELTQFLDAHFPETKKQKELTPEQTGKLWKFNPSTRDFDPVPPELTNLSGQELQKQGYRAYSDKQRSAVDEMKDIGTALQQLQSAISDIQGKNAIALKTSQLTGGNFGGPEGAVFQKAATNFTTIFDKFLGGVRGAGSPQMQAIRQKVLPSIISSGEVTNTLMKDLTDLVQAMGDSRLKSVVGGEAFKASELDTQANKVLDSFAKQHGVGEVPESLPAGAKPTGRTAGGKPVYLLPNGKHVVE
jgi:hypothetical protein